MGVELVKEGVYRIRWREGKRWRQHTLKGVTRKAANEFLHQKLGLKSQRKAGILKEHPWTFKALSDEWMTVHAESKFAPSWLGSVKSILKCHILPAFGDTLVSELRLVDVERYRTGRSKVAAGASVNRETTILFQVLTWAENMELIASAPIRPGRVRKLPERKREEFFLPEEWTRFTRAFDDVEAWKARMEGALRKVRHLIIDPGKGTSRRYGGPLRPGSNASEELRQRYLTAMPVFRALLLTGSRVGEILALGWSDVDFEERVVRIRQTKTGSVKVFPMTEALEKVIRAQTKKPGGLVFPNPESGKAWDQRRLQRIFKVALELAGLTKALTIHSIRHTSASWLTQAKEGGRHVQAALGHTSYATTERYAHLGGAEELRPAAETLEALVLEAENNQKGPARSAFVARGRKTR